MSIEWIVWRSVAPEEARRHTPVRPEPSRAYLVRVDLPELVEDFTDDHDWSWSRCDATHFESREQAVAFARHCEWKRYGLTKVTVTRKPKGAPS